MKKTFFVFLALWLVNTAEAQSYHFSQFFSTPLLTNPAHTGFTDGPSRVATNFRSQGTPGGNPYFTGYLSADVSPFRNQLAAGHKAGIGMYMMNDHSLGSAVQTNSVGLSIAYHVGLDMYGESSIGVGVQATYNQRRIDYSKLTFESQYGPGGYDGTLPVGEPLDFDSKHYFDVNAGVLYSAASANKSFFAGAAVYNILKHTENLLGEQFDAPTRFVIQAGGHLQLWEYGRAYFSLTDLYQAKANEITLGGAYGQRFSNEINNELILGLWYRHKDAVIPYVGFQFDKFQAGLSYDHTVSGLKTASQIRNAYELSLLFRAPNKRELKTTIPWY